VSVSVALTSLVSVATGVHGVSLRKVRVMSSLLRGTRLVVPCRFAMMTSGVLVMFGRRSVVLGVFAGGRHGCLSCCSRQLPPQFKEHA
jgi:hypothetical protein